MANARIAFIMYPVSDMARSTVFYADVLGLKKDGIDPICWILGVKDPDGNSIVLHQAK